MKKVKKSLRNQIIATGLCPIIIMSTTVAVISQRGGSPILIANVITVILIMSIIQLIYVANIIVKPIKKMEFNILQLTEGNLDITVEEKIKKRHDEIGSMSESLDRLSYQLKNSMTEIQNVSEKLLNSEEELNQMVGESNYVAIQINSSTKTLSAISKANVSSTKDTLGSIIRLNNSIKEIEHTSNQLVDYANVLDDEVRFFKR